MEAFDPNFTIRRRKLRGRPIRQGKGGRGEGEKSRNNYLAETPKNRAGARLGNRNAVTHGLHAVDSRVRRAERDALIRQSHALADAVLAVAELVRLLRQGAFLLPLPAHRVLPP